jgi:hypothetical protein
MADTENSAAVVVCANPVCRVAETGRCVDGLELNACPQYGRKAEGGSHSAELTGAGRAGIALPSADTLTLAEASSVLRAGASRVIAIIGPTDSGKTSLIASLYDLFQAGPVADIEFARSRTLQAFEYTCHDARAASRRGTPHMNRTPRGKVRFYHLDVGGGAAGERLALVLGDRAGEEYRELADDPSRATTLNELGRADSLTVLVDGERLIDSGARHNLHSEIILILQAMRDGGSLRDGLPLALVLTKLDAVQASPNAKRGARDFGTLLSEVRRLFGDVLSEVREFQIAASPKVDTVPRGTGVPQILLFWLGSAALPVTTELPSPTFERAFARLKPLAVAVNDG